MIPQPFASASSFGAPPVLEPGSPIAQRPVYPYSVSPGGVESPQELKEAMARDPVVAAHYRDFNLAALRVVRLESERAVYVSYRVHNDVFWTRKQLKLRAGEKLITDGTHSARTRCGNRISTLPQARTLPSEPSAEELETPQSPELYLALYPTLNTVLPLQTELPPSPLAPALVAPGEVAGVPVGGLLLPVVPAGGFPVMPGGGPPVIPGVTSFAPPCTRSPAEARRERDSCGPLPCIPTKDHPCPHPSPLSSVPEPGTLLLVVPGLVYPFHRWQRRD